MEMVLEGTVAFYKWCYIIKTVTNEFNKTFLCMLL